MNDQRCNLPRERQGLFVLGNPETQRWFGIDQLILLIGGCNDTECQSSITTISMNGQCRRVDMGTKLLREEETQHIEERRHSVLVHVIPGIEAVGISIPTLFQAVHQP